MQARQCWTVLANKAEDQCERIQQELSGIQQRIDGLHAQERRLRQLYAEYHERLTRPAAKSNGMQDTINLRQFMQQITALIDKVALDMSNTRHALRQTRQRLADAQEEKLKMQSLVEHDLHRQRTAEKLREQKQMDELAVRQFNINHLAGQA